MSEGIELARSLDESLEKILSPEILLDSVREDLPLEPSVTGTVNELGLAGVGVTERQGGLGLDLADRVRLAAVLGRRLVPATIRDEAFGAAPALAASREGEEHLDDLLAGETRVAVGLAGRDGSVFALVPAETELIATIRPDRVEIHRIDDVTVQIEPIQGLDAGQGLSVIDLDGSVPLFAYDGEDAMRVRREYEVCLVCETLGAAERTLEISAEYADDRKQFGRPISSFQAVTHLLGEMKLATETSRAGISRFVDLDREQEATRAELERWRATLVHSVPAASRRVCEGAIQVHGGIGFSWELGLHLYYRRILADQFLLGGESATAEEIGSVYLERRRAR